MFETLVVGPIAGPRLGIVRQCVECRAVAGLDASPCGGFGPGCIITPSRTPDRSVPSVAAAWRRTA